MVLDHDFVALAGKSRGARGVYQLMTSVQQLMEAHKNEIPRRVVDSSCKVQRLKAPLARAARRQLMSFITQRRSPVLGWQTNEFYY